MESSTEGKGIIITLSPPEDEDLEKRGSKEIEVVENGVYTSGEPERDQKKEAALIAKEDEEFRAKVAKIGDRRRRGKTKIQAWKVFKFANPLDILMILAGFFLSITSGLALPIHLLLFGEIVDMFFFHYAAVTEIANTSISTLAQSTAILLNTTCNTTMLEQNSFLSETVNNFSTALSCESNQTTLTSIMEFACEPDAQLFSEIERLSIYYGILAGANLVASFLASVFWNTSAYRQTRKMRQALYSSILRQEIGWFDVSNAHELNVRVVDDVERIQAGIGDKLSLFIDNFATFGGGFVIAFVVNWKMALIVAIMLPLIVGEAAFLGKAIAAFSQREQNAYAMAAAIAQEVLSSIRTVVAFGGEDREVERYNVHLRKARKEGLRKSFFRSLSLALVYVALFSTFALGFWYGSVLFLNCEMTIGNIIQVFFTLTFGSFYLGFAISELETFGAALNSAATIFKIINRKPLISTNSDGIILKKLNGSISFKDVVFYYPARPDVQVLRGMSLEIKQGQKVALVGPSGCGKSTIFQLLKRFYDINAGQITIDGREISSLNLKWLRSQIGVVSQEPVLFDTTIAENIRYGREDASMEDIQEAAKKANAHDFISKLPDGYNTLVGEGGIQISGGQKQRVAIARVLINNPRVLLLDEATSSLDSENEKVVQEALDKAREGRTTIVIAHRLSVIRNADVIVSLEDGLVAEKGTHAELMGLRGLYYDLVTAQTIAEKGSKKGMTKNLSGFRLALGSGRYRRASLCVPPRENLPGKVGLSYQVKSPWSRRSLFSLPDLPYYVKEAFFWQDAVAFKVGDQDSRQSSRSGSLRRSGASSRHSSIRSGSSAGARGAGSHRRNGSLRSSLRGQNRRAANLRAAKFNSLVEDPRQESPVEEVAIRVVPEEVEEEEEHQEDEDDVFVDVPEQPDIPEPLSILGRKAHYTPVKQDSETSMVDQPLRKVSFKQLLRLNKPDWQLVLCGVVFTILIGTIFPALAVLFGNILRAYSQSTREEIEENTKLVSAGFAGLALCSGIFYFIGYFTLDVAGERLTKRLRYKCFQAMLRQEVGWFDQSCNSSGALTTRLATDAADVNRITGIRLGINLRVVSGTIAAIVVGLVASWELTLFEVVIFPMLILVGFGEIYLIKGQVSKNKRRLEESSQVAVDSVENIRTVAGLGAEDIFFNRYRSLLSRPFKDNLKSVFVQAAVISVTNSLVFLLYVACYFLGAFLVVEGRAVYYDIFQAYTSVVLTAFILGRAICAAPDASHAKVSASRIFDLLNREPKIDASGPRGKKMDNIARADIAVKSVNFSYPSRPNAHIFEDFCVSVKPGKTLALVGPSGCGKTTVVSLLERFYDPLQGSLTLEGVDLRDLNLKWLRSQIGMVSQEPVLFDVSIAENIRYGALSREVSDEEVIEVAKAANIHSFIESLPEGYNTNVGSKGTQLSGGQKQRVAIARALVRDPKVLLLDEATSSLDTESEKVVQEALDKAREGRTTIVIAHRLSTIYNSDVIAVIHNGQVIESGTHSELMAAQGAYHLLNALQMAQRK